MSEEEIPFLNQVAECISLKIECGELPPDLDYILTCIREEVKTNLDKDYKPPISDSDESSDSDIDLIKEKVSINKTEDGFYYIDDNELDCDRIGRKKFKK